MRDGDMDDCGRLIGKASQLRCGFMAEHRVLARPQDGSPQACQARRFARECRVDTAVKALPVTLPDLRFDVRTGQPCSQQLLNCQHVTLKQRGTSQAFWQSGHDAQGACPGALAPLAACSVWINRHRHAYVVNFGTCPVPKSTS